MIPLFDYIGIGDIAFYEYFFTSVYMQWFYYGIITALFFVTIYQNRPNMIEIFLGRRIGNHLSIHTHKQISNKKTTFDKTRNDKKGTFVVDTAMSDVSIRHFAFETPALFFDEDGATSVIGIKGGKIIRNDKNEIVDFDKITKDNIDASNLSPEIKEAFKKGKIKVVKGKTPISYDVNPMWKLSSERLYTWFHGKMIATTWMAIIKQRLGDNGAWIPWIIGGVIGGLLVYTLLPSIEPAHVINTTTTITHTVFGNATSTSTSSTQTITRTIVSGNSTSTVTVNGGL